MIRPTRPAGFPLFAHASGKWARKVAGRTHYFGRWEDPQAALVAYNAFLASQRDTVSQAYLSVAEACNSFLEAKDRAVESRELTRRSFVEYTSTCKRVVEQFGRTTPVSSLGPENFSEYKRVRSSSLAVVAIGNEITRVKTIFRWCLDARLIKELPHFGPEFRKASAKVLRRHKRESGKKLLTPKQIRLILDQCGVHFRAMVLLGINCGFGNSDVANLPLDGVDLESGWIHFPRPKTETERRVPLWPETIKALKAARRRRYAPKPEAQNRFFVRLDGTPWDNKNNPFTKHFRQLLAWAGIHRGGFYWLRHTFETIGGASKDQVAVDAIMGHVNPSMAAVYLEDIGDDRLRAVVEHVRKWLFGL